MPDRRRPREFRYFISSLCSLFSVYFWGKNGLEHSQINGIRPVFEALKNVFVAREGLSVLLISGLIFLFYYRYDQNYRQPPKSSYAVAAVIGLDEVIGKNLLLNDGFNFYSETVWFPLMLSVICFLGNLFLWSRVYELLMEFISRHTVPHCCHKFINLFFNTHAFLYPAIFITICWLPYIVSQYPGILQIDARIALNQYYGITQWTTLHPPLGVLIMGKLMDFGRFLGSENLGCSLYVFPQTLLFITSLSFFFIILKNWQTPYWIRILICLFDGLFPFFPAYAMMEIKDTLYYIMYLWLIYAMIYFLETEKGKDKDQFKPLFKKFVLLSVTSGLFCLLRNEGKFILLFAACISFLSFTINKKKKLLFFSFCLLVNIGVASLINEGLCKYYAIKKGSLREALSIPAQQTGRYIREYREEISENEWQQLEKVFPEIDKLKYRPRFADSIKNYIREDIGDYLTSYFKIWYYQFLKHPFSYAEAVLCQTFGYFYIDTPEAYGNLYSIASSKHIYYGDLTSFQSPPLHKLIKSLFSLCSNLPIIKILFHPASYTWITLFAFLFIKRTAKRKPAVLFSLPMGIFLICCFSPVNAAMRYSIPMVFSAFICWTYAVHSQVAENG